MQKIFLILFVSLIPTLQSLVFEFTYDDFARLVNNERIKELSRISEYFLTPTWPGNLFRPFEELSYALTYKFFLLEPFYYHLSNIALNSLLCVALYIFLTKFLSTTQALFVALLFSLHPIHAEVVANISYRTELFVGLFTILSLISSLNSNVILFVLFFLLALISKESGIHVLILTPLTLLLANKNKKELIKFGIVSIIPLSIYLSLRYNALGGHLVIENYVNVHDNPLIKVDTSHRFLNALILLGRYSVLNFIPFHVSAINTFPKILPIREISNISMIQLFELAIFCSLVFSIYKFKNLRPWVLWFFLNFLITSNIASPIGTIFADRLNYLPSLMACGILVYLSFNFTKYPQTILSLICIVSGFLLFKNISYWKNNYTLFEHEAAQSPRCASAQFLFGREQMIIGKTDEAITLFNSAKTLYPLNANTTSLLSLSYFVQGDIENAKINAYQTLKLDPKNAIGDTVLYCTDKASSPECQDFKLKYKDFI